MDQNVEELVKGHRDAISVKRVFGEPYERNGVAIIPVARVFGGGGGGAGGSPGGEGEGSGTGFGLAGRPAGAYGGSAAMRWHGVPPSMSTGSSSERSSSPVSPC